MVRHVLDVLEQADRRVLVRVRRVGEVVQPLAQQRHRIREVQVVLAEDGARLGAKVVLAVAQVPEAVRFQIHDRLQSVRAGDDVVGRPVAGGERVRVGPDPLDHRVVGLGRVLLGAPEHHVLEEVGVPGEAGLHLVPRPGAHHRVVGDDAGAVVVDAYHLQPVVELEGGDREREDPAIVLSRRAGRAGQDDSRGDGDDAMLPSHGDVLLRAGPGLPEPYAPHGAPEYNGRRKSAVKPYGAPSAAGPAPCPRTASGIHCVAASACLDPGACAANGAAAPHAGGCRARQDADTRTGSPSGASVPAPRTPVDLHQGGRRSSPGSLAPAARPAAGRPDAGRVRRCGSQSGMGCSDAGGRAPKRLGPASTRRTGGKPHEQAAAHDQLAGGAVSGSP